MVRRQNALGTWTSVPRTIASLIGMTICVVAVLLLSAQASAHGGDEHVLADLGGRLPHQPDFERIQGVTTRFDPSTELYSIKKPGRPAVFGHVDSVPVHSSDGALAESGDESAENGLWYDLPTFEAAPECAASGHRIVVVRAYNEGSGHVPDEADGQIRSIVRRANWKFRQQAGISSFGNRFIEMKVDCDEANDIEVHDVVIPLNAVGPGFDMTDGIGVVDIVDYVEYLLGSPKNAEAVKYEIFGEQTFVGLGGIAWLRWGETNKTSSDDGGDPESNGNRTESTSAFITGNSWESNIPIHELTHAMGAVLNSAPYGTGGAHCADGLDIMCYNDGHSSPEYGSYAETRCPVSAGFDSSLGVPLDCMYDTYFNAATEPGGWLGQHWDVGGPENPFLVEPMKTPTYQLSFGSKGSGNGQFNKPKGLAIDDEGNVWVADNYNDRVEKFSSSGEYLAQFGGTGSGNGQLDGPTDIAIDQEGNLWVTDSNNSRVEKFSPKGEYLTQFGSYGGGNGQFKIPSGISIAPNGHIWVSDYWLGRVSEFTPGMQFVRNSNPGFSFLGGLEVDSSGHVWVADWGHNRVVELSSEGEFLSDFGSSGEGDGQLKEPSTIAVLPSGMLLVAEHANSRVQEFTTNGSYVTKFGEGYVTEPEGIAVGSDGAVYVANTYGGSVKKWIEPDAPTSNTLSATEIGEHGAALNATVNPNGVKTSYQFEYGTTTAYGSKVPASAEDIGSGTLNVNLKAPIEGLERATTYHYRVFAINEWGTTAGEDRTFTTHAPSPTYQLSFGSKGSGNGQFNKPKGIELDSQGNLWVVDSGNARLEKFDHDGKYLTQFGAKGSGNGQLLEPSDVAIDNEGNFWVTDTGNSRVQKFNTEGKYLAQFGSYGSGNGQFRIPSGIAIAPDGHLWVLDYWLGCVSEFTPEGKFVRKVTGLSYVHGLEIGADGHIWIASRGQSKVLEFSPDGKVLSEFGSKGKEDGQFENPTAIGILPSKALLVADRFGGRVQDVSTQGVYVTKFGEGQLTEPEGMAIDPGGAIYIANSYGNTVKKWIEPDAPTSNTLSATEIGEHSAALNATVNPNGVKTSYQFEYGTTTAYGSKSPVSPEDIGSGTLNVSLEASIEGLERATTYHYRVFAMNEWGTTVGEDRTFTTHAPSPAYQLSFGSKGSGNGQFNKPKGIAIDEEGNVWVADNYNDRVEKFSSSGEYLSQFGGTGSGNGKLDGPTDIAIDEEGDLWVTDSNNSRVEKFSPEGEYLAQVGSYGVGNGQFKIPSGISIAPNGHIWVSDYWLGRVSEFTADAQFVRNSNPGFSFLGGLEVDANGHVWVADWGHNRVVELSSEGQLIGAFGVSGGGDGQLKEPSTIAVLPSGRLLVTEHANNRVQEFTTNGGYVTKFGEGYVTEPEGIAVGSNGSVYVANTYGGSVKKWIEP